MVLTKSKDLEGFTGRVKVRVAELSLIPTNTLVGPVAIDAIVGSELTT